MALDLVADTLAGYVEDAGDESPADVGRDLMSGVAQLWLMGIGGAISGVVVSRLERRPAGLFLTAPYGYGKDADLWKADFHEAALAFAKAAGCLRIEITGREGWLRKLACLGWKKIAAVYRIEVDG